MDEYGAITLVCDPLYINAHKTAPSKTDNKHVVTK